MRDFAKLFQLLRPYRYRVALSTVSHLLMAVFTIISIPLIIPFFHFLFATRPEQTEKPDSIFNIIDWLQYYFVQMINNLGAEKTLIYACVFIVITIFLKNLFRYLALYIMTPVRSAVARDLRSKLYESFMVFSFDQEKIRQRGDLLTRMGSDVQEIEWNMLRFIDTIIKSPIIIIGAVLLMLSISIKLSLFVVVLMIFTGLVIGTLSRRLKRQSSELQSKLSQITQSADESLDGAMLIKVYKVKKWWQSRFEGINEAYKSKFDSVTRRQELSSPLSEFLGITVVVALLWYGARLVMQNELEAETFFAFVIAFYHVIEPLKSFSTAFYYLRRGSASLERIEKLISESADDERTDGNEPFKFEDSISFNNVSYAYAEKPVLKNLNLKLLKGEKIALVGPSGAGKSTIVRLILKVLNCEQGDILVDGTSLLSINRSELYGSIGYVSQHSFLFDDTVRNNISLGRSDISDEKIKQCLTLACADQFVGQLEQGLDTRIGEHGAKLSGGEKQRLTIARALVSDPELLIFDEPTSALDADSEKVVSQAITNVLEDRTAIIIAHRLSTIKNVNNIFVIDNGEVVEEGSHERLIEKQGKYARYVQIQSFDE